MKQFIKSHLAWIRKKLHYPTEGGMNYFEFETIREVIRYYAPIVVGFNYRFLKDMKKSITQMRSMRTAYT